MSIIIDPSQNLFRPYIYKREAEFEAEKMKTDRQARTGLKNLEAKRDELKQRLAEARLNA